MSGRPEVRPPHPSWKRTEIRIEGYTREVLGFISPSNTVSVLDDYSVQVTIRRTNDGLEIFANPNELEMALLWAEMGDSGMVVIPLKRGLRLSSSQKKKNRLDILPYKPGEKEEWEAKRRGKGRR